jgi:hypothetical protein
VQRSLLELLLEALVFVQSAPVFDDQAVLDPPDLEVWTSADVSRSVSTTRL